ncbi:B3/B4 domain-containing protein [Paucilactobacillus wasatchensis]|uniref:B3/B4 tRNA-binding domain-containing protein n=1 Tax=Paucilactobacillus wasatchensis TaxID=1335616 RepID=A0A0D0Y6Q3_9LACO|nr:phenylalanine--tRNA ligase beta subunit-related protein [Paucilactobacillus wasatchensis]KIS03958.1 hypothetical protein WDC_0410 [Paucilactobacillus wasatchensis]
MIIDNEFWELFPDATIYSLVAKRLNNNDEDTAFYEQLLSAAEKEAQQYIQTEPFRENPVVAQWREAFTKFKTKKGARSSIEALLKRVSQGKELGTINPLVDIYNSMSLKHGVPCGGEDLNAMDGELHLGVAKGGEQFLPLGAEEDAPALTGEVIYYDQTGAICRCFNWREAQRTMLTENTTNAVLIIESINAEQSKRAKEAIEELQQLINDRFGVETTSSTFKK